MITPCGDWQSNCGGPSLGAGRSRRVSYGRGQVISGGPFANRPDTPQVTSRLDTAKWIWLEEGSPANAAPPGARYFRRTLNLPLDRPVASAHLAMTADNRFACWINGQRAGGSSDFTQAYGMNVTTLVQPGTNLVAVTARNGSNQPNPAGLIGALTIRYRDGGMSVVPTDHSWQVAAAAAGAWKTDPCAAVDWTAAMELGPPGMPPWGDVEPSLGTADIYPSAEAAGRLLASRRCAPRLLMSEPAGGAGACATFTEWWATRTSISLPTRPRPTAAWCRFRVRESGPNGGGLGDGPDEWRARI